MRTHLRLLTEKWPFSAAPEPPSSPYHGRTYWAHVLDGEKTWNLIIQLDAEPVGQTEFMAHVHFKHPDAPHALLKPGKVVDLCVGRTLYARASILGET